MPTRLADSIVIEAPAEVAWAFVSDPPRLYASRPNTTVRLLNGAFDTAGSRYLVTTRAAGQVLDATHEIVRIEAPRLLETRTTSQGTVSISFLQVEPIRDDACVLIMQGQIDWGGSFMAVVSRVFTGVFGRRTMAAELERMKGAIEEDARNRAAALADRAPHLAEEG